MTWTNLPVLMYHSVSAVDGPMRDLAVPPRLLAEQLGALREAGYELVGLTEALARVDGGGRLMAVTFDDGYRDFLTEALPVLRDTGSRATLYASTGHLGARADWLGPSKDAFGPMLTWDELAEVAAHGIVEIGNHSHVHHPLDVLPAAQLRREITRSHEALTGRLGRPRSFAYPHGYHHRRVRDLVASLGYDNATEVGRRLHSPRDDRFAVPRLQPTPDHSGADLVALAATGEPGLTPGLKRLARPGWRLARRAARLAGKRLT